MSFPCYPKYKDSGVEWLGEVPEHWEVLPLKRIVAVPITDGPHETPQFVEDGVPFVSAEAISSGRIDFTKIRAHITDEDNARYSLKYSPRVHDIYMVKSGATTGVTAIVEGRTDFNIWSPLAAIRCNEDAVPHFILNFLRSRRFLEAVTLSWSFGTQQNIGMRVIENLSCTLPPKDEQLAIAAFLDRETAKIDALVGEQRRLIELLKEKRQAVISHAVTKGLNPNVPMKPSGIDWLGDVPEHWKVVRAKAVAAVFVPQRNKPDLNSHAAGTCWVTMEQMGSDLIDETPLHVSERAAKDAGSRVLRPGAVIASCVGQFNVCAINLVDVIINQQLQAYIPGSQIYADYLRFLVLLSTSYFERVATAATVTYVNQSGFESLPLLVPPLKEQVGIVTATQTQLDELDSLTSKAERAIELLQERRTALISAAVTGKIDVRALAAQAEAA